MNEAMTVAINTETIDMAVDMPLERLGERPVCYACARGLVGQIKQQPQYDDDDYDDDDCDDNDGDEYISCECSHDIDIPDDDNDDVERWECWCSSIKQSEWMSYCPICGEWFYQSRHLRDAITDPRTRWLANMVTHYRHEHRAWDSQLRRLECYGQDTYARQKSKINEQAKRQIIRRCRDYMLSHGIGVEHVAALQHTTDDTIDVARAVLEGAKIPRKRRERRERIPDDMITSGFLKGKRLDEVEIRYITYMLRKGFGRKALRAAAMRLMNELTNGEFEKTMRLPERSGWSKLTPAQVRELLAKKKQAETVAA